MKKLLFATTVALTALSAIAAVPRVTIEEAKRTIDEGRAIRPTIKMQTPAREALFSSAGKAYISPLTSKRNLSAKVPSKVTAGGSNIYGYLGYTSYSDTPIGLYTIDANGYTLKWADKAYEDEGFVLSAGWFDGERVCGFAPVEFFGYIADLYYFEYEFETGTIITDRQANMDNGMFSSATYSPQDKYIYGYGEDSNGGLAFLKAPASAPDELEVIRLAESPENACTSITFNPANNKLYGVTLGGTFVSIDNDGTQTEIMKLTVLDEAPEFIGGLVYSPVEDVFFYNYITDFSSDLYKIDINRKTAEFVDLYGKTTFPILFTTDSAINPEAPAMPEIIKFDFTNGSNSGNITYKLPATTENGDKLEGVLSWTALLDNTEYKTGTGAPGTEVIVQYADINEGLHSFAFYASTADLDSRVNAERRFVGFDTPATPENVSLSETQITWSAVSSGVNGGYVNSAEIEYEAFLNGKSIGKTSSTKIDIQIPDGELSTYEASVTATCGGKTSAPGKSNTIISGKPFRPDVTFTPTESEAQLFTIIDTGSDGFSWYYDPEVYATTAFATDYDPYKPMDDWLILPPVTLDNPDRFYMFAMDCRRFGSYIEDDYFEVCIGKSPEPAAMTSIIIPKTKPEYFSEWEKWGDYSQLFQIAEAGTYYIGIHCISDANQYGILVRNMSILDPGISSKSPVAVTDAIATAAGNGALEAEIAFTMPTKTIDGSEIPAETELTAVISGTSISTVKGKPGSKITTSVATAQGDNTISIAVNAGEANGIKATVSVYTGVHIPGVVTNLTGTLSDDMLTFTLSWEAPTASEDGGYFDPSTVSYQYYTYDETWGWQKAADLGTVKTYTFTLPAGTEQDLYRMGIVTCNAAGTGSRVTGITSVMGTPYTLPMTEDFEGGEDDPMQINPWTYYTPTSEYDGQLWSVEKVANVSDKWSNQSTSVLVGTSRNATGKGKMAIPRFTTANASDVELELLSWAGENAATINITAIANGMDSEVSIGTVLPGNGWKKSFITLPKEFNGKGWVQLYIDTEYKTAKDMCVIESLEVSGQTSGIGNISAANGIVRGGKGQILISGFDSGDIIVYTVDGKAIATGSAQYGEQILTVPAGLYIVRVCGQSYKVIVK